jgi:hypothetical protein
MRELQKLLSPAIAGIEDHDGKSRNDCKHPDLNEPIHGTSLGLNDPLM